MVNKACIAPKFMQKQINTQNSYLLLAFLQSGSVPELDMHKSKHFLPGQFVHSDLSASSDNIILYRYVLTERDNNMMLDILVFLLTISYCTGMY